MYHDLVSIIMPAYKAQSTIGAAIESAQRQTCKHWELLVVDDGSTDYTDLIVESMSRCDARIKLIKQLNAGPAMARQTGLNHAKGRYIAFLDSDDLWLPEKLERQIGFMKSENKALSFTSYRRFKSDTTSPGRVIAAPKTLSYKQLLGNTAIATSTAIVDTMLTGRLEMPNTYYDDFALWLKLTRCGWIAYGLNEDLMRYRVTKGSVSSNKVKSAKMVWRTYRQIERLGFAEATYCLTRYMLNGTIKHLGF